MRIDGNHTVARWLTQPFIKLPSAVRNQKGHAMNKKSFEGNRNGTKKIDGELKRGRCVDVKFFNPGLSKYSSSYCARLLADCTAICGEGSQVSAQLLTHRRGGIWRPQGERPHCVLQSSGARSSAWGELRSGRRAPHDGDGGAGKSAGPERPGPATVSLRA